jgi:hypothetical protein|tara:strand:- start:437 stop:652 length:216 start_codon:yes stop_codon:yes gene_type:complete
MTTLILDDKEYNTDDLDDNQKQIVNILNVGTNSVALLNHIVQCVQAVQQLKTNELRSSLDLKDDDQSELEL